MICAVDAILNLEIFKDITHILKVDGKDNSFANLNETDIYKHDYIGQRVNKVGYNIRTWHFNKVSVDSPWHNKEYNGKYVDWADGGTSYILSRNSLEMINSVYSFNNLAEVLVDHIYEDLMIAIILHGYDIIPVELNYNVDGDKEILV